jgi:hypothetical protein
MMPQQPLDDLDRLLDAVHHPEHDATLSQDVLREVEEVRSIMRAVDASWRLVDPSAHDRLRAKTLARLRARGSEHVWGTVAAVNTLGDLVRASEELLDILPTATLTMLESDSSPIDTLLRDPDSRQDALAASFKRASIPGNASIATFRRILHALSGVAAASGAGGFVYARPQRRQSPARNNENSSGPAARD